MPKRNPKNTPGSRKSKKRSNAQRKKTKKAPRSLEEMRELTNTYNAIKREEAELKEGETLSEEKQRFLDFIDEEAPKAAEAAVKIRKEESKGRNTGKVRLWLFRKKEKE